ncbi:reverse transcriptase domain-containing protein [Algiphilus sp.]|uniref:reverse transcriptase domain-containing protein n=1 Tax=Algiphilus sp. TaxID=1872431 RepID=UPI0025BC3C7B|nr:reverse transcriptase domain-containing protein [Algiphilus sp.]MCK5770901.1 hypothetical protein [Algiphilus sp.]
MTKPRYPQGCPAGSQACGDASSSLFAGDSDNAWIVNFHNGNANIYNRDNDNAFVRAVRGPVRAASECQGAVSFAGLYRAWQAARRHKRPSRNQLAFEADWADNLLALEARITAGTWSPAPSTCFIASRNKAREIHAPDFGDRVVHHWLVPQLERIFEPGFIHDSYSNRPGKGTHAAVTRLQRFVRQVHSGQRGGWYLQLDVANFFNAIHRPTLWRILKRRMAAHGLPDATQRVAHALLRRSPTAQGVHYRATRQERALVPPHKRLHNAGRGRGLPIGNLSSQFFANVYLDRLDQFVKHQLCAKRYIRYVDDFVLAHHDRAQLEQWQHAIERFLHTELRLRLKPEVKLQPLSTGIDFLGYIVHPTHTRVRRRVISHAREALHRIERDHLRGNRLLLTPEQLRRAVSTWHSYRAHFRHANARALVDGFHRHHPWLHAITARRRLDYQLEGRRIAIPVSEHRP